ncbi:MBL fold metallo-hydrolase [Mesobacillus maritimus]|uniref:MBL fold metallo-hydrolase n=1 Tax=Mesobacillus maritimus TaxID=1643336 RepID=A0ABS7K7J8_9BACI|nr:MBL fold metallo-hydrolase [Mesobacillus maritimus]MBY0098168.1 MBL fold metallo-hydrolase [Mesobacillus maritimus]
MIIWKDESITLFRSSLYETISSVIVTNDCVIVVDPCWLPHEIIEIKQYVEDVRQNRPLFLLFTHSDFDHIIGYGAFPEVKVIASQAFADKPSQEKERIIEEIKSFDDDYYITRDYRISYPEVDFPILDNEQSMQIGQTKLTFFQASGHNDDGLFTIIEPLGIFIAGDYFSDIEFPYIYFNSKEYEKTISLLDDILPKFNIQLLVTGHGNPTRDPAEMKNRQQASLSYIKKMREYVKENNESGSLSLIEGCKFPRNMKKFHKQNYSLLEKEQSR